MNIRRANFLMAFERIQGRKPIANHKNVTHLMRMWPPGVPGPLGCRVEPPSWLWRHGMGIRCQIGKDVYKLPWRELDAFLCADPELVPEKSAKVVKDGIEMLDSV